MGRHASLGMSFGILLAVASGAAAARGTHVDADCNVHSDYDFALSAKSVILTRDHAGSKPKTVLMRQGRLFVDNRWVDVTSADRDRLIRYEREARAAVPLAQQIGRDASEIAFAAVGAVAKGLSDDPAKTDAKLAKARAQLDRELARSMSATHFDGEDIGRSIGSAVQQVMPMIVGDITGAAVRTAFSGDTSRFEKLDGIDKDIDALIEPRAAALERNARQLCDTMRGLDAIDNALDFRHDGRPLDLLRVDARHDDSDNGDSDSDDDDDEDHHTHDRDHA